MYQSMCNVKSINGGKYQCNENIGNNHALAKACNGAHSANGA